MSAATAPAPSMFAVFRRRDFSLLWLAQLDLDGGLVADRPGRRHLGLPRDRVGAGRRPDAHGDRHPEPRRRACSPASTSTATTGKRIMIVTCLVQSVVVGLIALTVEFDSIVGLYALLLLNAGVKQFFDPAHDSLIPEMASDEELAAANAFLSIAAFGSTAIGFAGAGPAREHGRADLGVHPRCRRRSSCAPASSR